MESVKSVSVILVPGVTLIYDAEAQSIFSVFETEDKE